MKERKKKNDIQVAVSDLYETEDGLGEEDFDKDIESLDLLNSDWKNMIKGPLDFNYSFMESASTPTKRLNPTRTSRQGFGVVKKVVEELDHEKMINSTKNDELFGSAKRAYEKKEINKLYTFKAPRTAPVSFRKPKMSRLSKTAQGVRGSHHTPRSVEDRKKRTIHSIDADILKIMAEHRRFMDQSKNLGKRKRTHPPKKKKKKNPFELIPTHFNIDDQEVSFENTTMEQSFKTSQIQPIKPPKERVNVPMPHTEIPSMEETSKERSIPERSVNFEANPSNDLSINRTSNVSRSHTSKYEYRDHEDRFDHRVAPTIELDVSKQKMMEHIPPIFKSTPKTPGFRDDLGILSPFSPTGMLTSFKQKSRRFSEEISVRDIAEKKKQEEKRKATPVGDLILKLDKPLKLTKKRKKPTLTKSRLLTLSTPKKLKKPVYVPPKKEERQEGNFIHRKYKPHSRMKTSLSKQMEFDQLNQRKAKKRANDFSKTKFHYKKGEKEEDIEPPPRHLPIMTSPSESRSSSRFSTRKRKKKKKRRTIKDAITRFIEGGHSNFSLDSPTWEYYRKLDEPTKRHKSIYRVDHGGVVLYKYSEPGLRPGEEEEEEDLK